MMTVVLADCIDCARTVPWMMLMMMSMVMCNQTGVDSLNSKSGTFDCKLQPYALKARHCYACHHTYISMGMPLQPPTSSNKHKGLAGLLQGGIHWLNT